MERVDQITDGTFPHARLAIQNIFTVTKCEICGEKSCRRARVADEKFSLLSRDFSAEACDNHFLIGVVKLNIETECLQGSDEVMRIVRKERIVKRGVPFRNAEIIKARFVSDLERGTRTVA